MHLLLNKDLFYFSPSYMAGIDVADKFMFRKVIRYGLHEVRFFFLKYINYKD